MESRWWIKLTYYYFLVYDSSVAIPLHTIYLILFTLAEEPLVRSNIFSGSPSKPTCFPDNHSASLLLLFLEISICSSIYRLLDILGWCAWLAYTMGSDRQVATFPFPLQTMCIIDYDKYVLISSRLHMALLPIHLFLPILISAKCFSHYHFYGWPVSI